MTTTELTHDALDAIGQLAQLPWGVDILTRVYIGATEGLVDHETLMDAAGRGYWSAALYLHDAVPADRVEAWRASLRLHRPSA